MCEAIVEACMGHLSHHLLSQGGTRVLAIIDVGDKVKDEKQKQPQALVVRYGNHIRPAHATIVTTPVKDPKIWEPEFDRDRLSAISCLPQEEQANAMAQGHARTAAQQLRWRILHGVLADSNNGLYGQMLDHDYTSTQSRTAPVHGMNDEKIQKMGSFVDYMFRIEAKNRHALLARMKYEGIEQLYKKYYSHYKTVEMLRACGIAENWPLP
ncbi:MAG: hypothetical protein HC848_00760 [Limnobacter sp.]|nr:hypothetical protein [Limnobacter sp.]